MEQSAKKIEQKTLLIGVSIYFILSFCSYVVYYISGVEAMFLDASFSLISTISTLFAMFISKYSAKKSLKFPNGLFILEPFYGIVKSLLILTITTLSCLQVSQSAFSYFVYDKGEMLNFRPIIPYSILCTISCLSLHFLYKRKNTLLKNTSTMLSAESRSTLIDGVMCCGIGILATAAIFIEKGDSLDFLLYTGDFFVTILLSLIMIKEPFLILQQSFSELVSGNMPDSYVKSDIQQTIKEKFSTELNEHVRHSIIKTGMSFRVFFFIDKTDEEMSMQHFFEKVKQIDEILSDKYEYLQVEIILY